MDTSDSQFEFEDKYDDDFYDDDVSGDDTNNQDDSGMEEKGRSYDTDSDHEIKKSVPANKLKKNSPKTNAKDKKTPRRNGDQYKTYLTPVAKRAQSDSYGRKTKKSGSAIPPNGSSSQKSSAHNAVIKRVLSASRKKTSAMHNIIYELQQQVEELSISNRDLIRNSKVQERDLRKLDGAEAQLPLLMKKHSNEVNVLQEKYKRQKDVSVNLAENLKKADNELLKTKDKLKEYQGMVEQKNLGERIELKNRILNLEKLIEEKDNKITELNRNLMLQKKSHARVIKEKNEKYAKAKEQFKNLEEVNRELVQRLKDREKALEVTNIYSRRVQKDNREVVMFSPNDPIHPIFKKYQEESLEISQNLENRLELCERKEKTPPRNDSRGDRVDTMVSRNGDGEEDEVYQSTPRTGEPVPETLTTFVTEGKLTRQDTEEFYDVNNGKELVKLTTKGKDANSALEAAPSAENELHEKLDKMIDKRKAGEEEYTIVFAKEHVEKEEVKRGNPPSVNSQKTNVFSENSLSPDFDEQARKRKLLLAKIQAIDKGENPNDVTPSTVVVEKKSKPKKPIFLESPKSSAPVSDEDIPSIKPIDDYSSGNSKSNSGTLKSRRNRPFPFVDSFSGSETDSSSKTRPRKDSWDFKITDENLHNGIPSHDDSPLASNRTLPSQKRNNDRSLTGAYKTDSVNGTKNRTKAITPNYSPTALDSNIAQDRKTNSHKNNNVNLFELFDDPFKSTNKSKVENGVSNFDTNKSASSRKSDDERNELLSKSSKDLLTPETPVIDDLEEMFIL